jgi:hypothetical protein
VKRLPVQKLRHIQHIVIEEDSFSVNDPACHAQGLVEICKGHPQLYVERHISFLTTVFPDGMESIFGWAPELRCAMESLETIVDWIQEARDLFKLGMPDGRFKLVIDGTAEESVKCWKLLKQAATLQDAMLKWAHTHNVVPHNIPYDGRYNYGPYTLPWLLPANFSRTIHDMIQGTSFVGLDGPVGELWDEDVLSYLTKDWTLAEWRKEWGETVLKCSIHIKCVRSLQQHYSETELVTKKTTKMVRNGRVIREERQSWWELG